MNCPHCKTHIDEHQADRCLDAWIAQDVLDWFESQLEPVTEQWRLFRPNFLTTQPVSIPFYSKHMDVTWRDLVPTIAEWMQWRGADGFFHLVHAEWADHSIHDTCKPVPDPDDDNRDRDPLPWTAHIHVGLISSDGSTPEHWDHGDAFCARAETAQLAICKAVIKAVVT